MAAITDYASLTTEIGAQMKRSYSSADTDGFIGLSEGDFRLYLGPNFAKDASATPTFVNGSAPLPAGFVRPIAVSHSTYGLLNGTDIGTIRQSRINGDAIPTMFAVTGATIELNDAGYSGTDITLDYEGTLAGLSSGNTTNWLVVNAPQVYLKMCLSYANARLKSFDQAAALRQAAMQDLADLGVQSTVAQLARAAVHIPGSTP